MTVPNSEAESMGFILPTGTDLIRHGDDAITQNALAAATLIKAANPFKKHIPASSDLNAYTEPGTYYYSLRDSNQTIVNRPSETHLNAFRLDVLEAGPPSGAHTVYQTFTTGGGGEIHSWMRYMVAGNWQPWHKVIDTENAPLEDSNPYKGEIAQNGNLDTYTASGFYYSPIAARTRSITSRPNDAPDYAFRLEVHEVYDAAISHTVHQTYVAGSAGQMYGWVRYKLANTWHPWHNVMDTSQDPTTPGGVTETDRTKITLIGDSQLQNETQLVEAMQSRLGPVTTIDNRAGGGNTIDRVNILAGVKELWFSISGGQIPASGPVEVDTSQHYDSTADFSFSGTLSDISGVLFFDSSNRTWTFTRSSTGPAKSVAGLTRFVSWQAVPSHHTMVVWVGGNNTSTTPENILHSSTAEHVISGHHQIMTWAAPQKHVLLSGITYAKNSEPGEPRYELANEVNAWLAEHYPTQFCGVNDWLINHGMQAAGLTDTQEDIDARAAGLMPPSLLYDNVHAKPEVRSATGQHLAEQLRKRGWA